MREEIILVLYIWFFFESQQLILWCSLWLPELRIISRALNITCGFLLSFIENNNSQDHFHPSCNLNLATGQAVGYKSIYILSHIFSFKSNMSSSFTVFLIALSFPSQGSILPSSCLLCSSGDAQSANYWLNAVPLLWPWHWRWAGAGQRSCSESCLGTATGYRLTRKSQRDR